MENFNPITIANPSRLAAVAMAQATEQSRYYLLGVHFTAERMEATSGHIATFAELELDADRPDCIMPVSKKAIAVLKGNKAETAVFDGDTLTVFNSQGEPIHIETSKPIDGTFPDAARIIPSVAESKETPLAAFSTNIMAILNDTAKAVAPGRVGCFAMFGDGASGPHGVRYSDVEDVFSVAMPMRANVARQYPAFIKR